MGDLISLRPSAMPQEQSSAGTYGFVQDDEPAEIHVTAGLTKTSAVRVRGRIWWEFNEATAAYRIASAMMTLNSYGFLDCVSTPSEVVRRRLAASVLECSRDHALTTSGLRGAVAREVPDHGEDL